jgi:hypothetical protein
MPFVQASAHELERRGHITPSGPPSWPHLTVPGRSDELLSRHRPLVRRRLPNQNPQRVRVGGPPPIGPQARRSARITFPSHGRGRRFDPGIAHQEVAANRPGFPAPTIPRLFSALAGSDISAEETLSLRARRLGCTFQRLRQAPFRSGIGAATALDPSHAGVMPYGPAESWLPRLSATPHPRRDVCVVWIRLPSVVTT